MVLVFAVIVVIMVIRKAVSNKKAAAEVPVTQNSLADKPDPEPAPGSAGGIKLHDVDPRTAAMAMAIVANKLNKPLNELRFISIKEVR